MLRPRHALLAATLPILTALSPSTHAYQQTQPTTQIVGDAQRLQATVTGVEGIVQVRTAPDQPWQKAVEGMVLDQGAEFRTGPRSAVRFTLPGEQVVTLDRLGTVQLLDAVRSGARTKTDLGMQYGRVRYDIEAAGQEHDSTIHTPGSTLAVRGTRVGVESTAAFPNKVYSLEGRAFFSDNRGKSGYFGGNAGTSTINADVGTPAGTAFTQTFVDPTAAGSRSPGEQVAILQTPVILPPSGGASPLSNSVIAPPVVIPPPVTPPDIQIGSLVFQLVWIQSSTDKKSLTPDLDLFVFTPRSEQLCPKDCPPTVPSGGISPKDDIGGQTFRFGEELALFPKNFPLGQYTFGVRHVEGESAEFQIAVLRDGDLIGKPLNGTVDSTDNTVSYTSTVTAKGTGTPTQNPGTGKPTTPTKPVQTASATAKAPKPSKTSQKPSQKPAAKPVTKPSSRQVARRN